jgi:hypothetical protein
MGTIAGKVIPESVVLRSGFVEKDGLTIISRSITLKISSDFS